MTEKYIAQLETALGPNWLRYFPGLQLTEQDLAQAVAEVAFAGVA